MGMSSIFLRVSLEDLQKFVGKGDLFLEYIASIYSYEDDEIGEVLLDLDKSWDGLIYLLTGSSLHNAPKDSFASLFFSGQLIDPEQDVGYGPAHYLTPDQVKRYWQKLEQLNKDVLRSRYDASMMNDAEVYPNYWTDDNEEIDYLMTIFEELLAFMQVAVEEEAAIITYLS